eukprot:365263-Chlamydomonas_euryale.AAC.21
MGRAGVDSAADLTVEVDPANIYVHVPGRYRLVGCCGCQKNILGMLLARMNLPCRSSSMCIGMVLGMRLHAPHHATGQHIAAHAPLLGWQDLGRAPYCSGRSAVCAANASEYKQSA